MYKFFALLFFSLTTLTAIGLFVGLDSFFGGVLFWIILLGYAVFYPIFVFALLFKSFFEYKVKLFQPLVKALGKVFKTVSKRVSLLANTLTLVFILVLGVFAFLAAVKSFSMFAVPYFYQDVKDVFYVYSQGAGGFGDDLETITEEVADVKALLYLQAQEEFFSKNQEDYVVEGSEFSYTFSTVKKDLKIAKYPDVYDYTLSLCDKSKASMDFEVRCTPVHSTVGRYAELQVKIAQNEIIEDASVSRFQIGRVADTWFYVLKVATSKRNTEVLFYPYRAGRLDTQYFGRVTESVYGGETSSDYSVLEMGSDYVYLSEVISTSASEEINKLKLYVDELNQIVNVITVD